MCLETSGDGFRNFTRHISIKRATDLRCTWATMPWPWASCQIREIIGCACAANGGTFSPSPWFSIPTYITARAWRTCRSACRDRKLAVFFEVFGRSRHSRRMRNPQFYQSPHRISAGGCLLFMRCVCVPDLNRTSFSMATRGSTLGNFG